MATQLKDKVVSGVAWSITEKVGSMLLQMVVSIVVARLLLPEDFGVLAILTFFTALSTLFVDSGFSQTLIRKSNPTEADYKSVFIFNIVVSVALYALLVGVSPLIASYYDLPIISRIAPVLMLLLPLSALGVIQNTIFARQFRFATLSRINLTASAVAGAVAVAMALTDCGVWSLVGQRLAQMTIKSALLWVYGSWRGSGEFSIAALKGMGGFSMRLLAKDTISYLYNNISQLFIGKIYSADTLGFFNQAQKLKELPVTSAVQSFQSVTYPALSKIKDNPTKFADSFRYVVMMTAAVMFPAMVGMIAVADDMFLLMLGERWLPTVQYFKILSLTGLTMPLQMIAYNVLKVKGDGRAILRIEVACKVIMTAILALAIPHSVMAVAWGLFAMSAVETVMNMAVASRLSGVGATRLVATLLPIATITAAMYCTVIGIQHLTSQLTLGVRFALQVAVGVVVYTLLAVVFRMEFVQQALQILRGAIYRNNS